jgi:hypothetical protein
MFLRTLSPTIFSQINKEAVMNFLREQRIKLYDKRIKQITADELSKRVIYRLS